MLKQNFVPGRISNFLKFKSLKSLKGYQTFKNRSILDNTYKIKAVAENSIMLVSFYV